VKNVHKFLHILKYGLKYLISVLVQVKLNLSLLEDVSDDIDFCFKLAREESVILLPGKDIISLFYDELNIY